LPGGSTRRTRDQRRRVQMIFQDPLSSLNPRQRVLSAVARPIEVFFGVSATRARQRAAALLAELGLGDAYLDRFPRQLSGGQQQRVAIARAFAAEPDLIICDEVTSALDATIQGQVLDALLAMQHRRGVAMLVITHDLAVVWRLAQRVLVLQQGRVHEQGATAQVFAAPQSPYTRELLQASTAAARLTHMAATAPRAALAEDARHVA
jgi:peptide/nickel transport system ATP-binding protein